MLSQNHTWCCKHGPCLSFLFLFQICCFANSSRCSSWWPIVSLLFEWKICVGRTGIFLDISQLYFHLVLNFIVIVIWFPPAIVSVTAIVFSTEIVELFSWAKYCEHWQLVCVGGSSQLAAQYFTAWPPKTLNIETNKCSKEYKKQTDWLFTVSIINQPPNTEMNYKHCHRRNVTSHRSFSFLWLFQLSWI